MCLCQVFLSIWSMGGQMEVCSYAITGLTRLIRSHSSAKLEEEIGNNRAF